MLQCIGGWVSDMQVEAAKQTVEKISTEESSLKATLSNIQEARPFEDLTVGLALGMRERRTDEAGRRGCQGPPRGQQSRRDHDQEGQVDRARLPG